MRPQGIHVAIQRQPFNTQLPIRSIPMPLWHYATPPIPPPLIQIKKLRKVCRKNTSYPDESSTCLALSISSNTRWRKKSG
jgi:hypothetical protein